MSKELEKEYHLRLPKRSYAVVRVDGKGFSKYTKGLEKPFDWGFTQDMRETARFLCESIDGAVLGYTQSDEISVVFSDLGGESTQWWFGGQVQKIVSVSAALATAKFGALRYARGEKGMPVFDARVHHLEGEEGIIEYLRWRQEDAFKNSVGMLASHHFPHRELMGVSTEDRIGKLEREKGILWYDLDGAVRHGSWVRRELRNRTTTYVQKGETKTVDFQRKEWVVGNAPGFWYATSLGMGLNS